MVLWPTNLEKAGREEEKRLAIGIMPGWKNPPPTSTSVESSANQGGQETEGPTQNGEAEGPPQNGEGNEQQPGEGVAVAVLDDTAATESSTLEQLLGVLDEDQSGGDQDGPPTDAVASAILNASVSLEKVVVLPILQCIYSVLSRIFNPFKCCNAVFSIHFGLGYISCFLVERNCRPTRAPSLSGVVGREQLCENKWCSKRGCCWRESSPPRQRCIQSLSRAKAAHG